MADLCSVLNLVVLLNKAHFHLWQPIKKQQRGHEQAVEKISWILFLLKWHFDEYQ